VGSQRSDRESVGDDLAAIADDIAVDAQRLHDIAQLKKTLEPADPRRLALSLESEALGVRLAGTTRGESELQQRADRLRSN
jgi:hypothetical protein